MNESSRMRMKSIGRAVLFIAIGMIVGGYLFSRSLPRSFLAFTACQQNCLQANDLVGLVASVGIQRFSGALPEVVRETDHTLAIRHPSPQAATHYVIIPKKDIGNASAIAAEDEIYLTDAYAVIGDLIRSEHLRHWQVVTFGPEKQQVTYLHFHLIDDGS